jgi:hypothetical protein
MIMEYEEIEAMINYCMNKVRDLDDADKVEVLQTVCCELRDKIGFIEYQLDNEEEECV